jgi:hypothetical protein
MDNWNPTLVYQMATERHGEQIKRLEYAQLVAAQGTGQPARARLAGALIALAARLNTECPTSALCCQAR